MLVYLWLPFTTTIFTQFSCPPLHELLIIVWLVDNQKKEHTKKLIVDVKYNVTGMLHNSFTFTS